MFFGIWPDLKLALTTHMEFWMLLCQNSTEAGRFENQSFYVRGTSQGAKFICIIHKKQAPHPLSDHLCDSVSAWMNTLINWFSSGLMGIKYAC